jgi:hypothetical protein
MSNPVQITDTYQSASIIIFGDIQGIDDRNKGAEPATTKGTAASIRENEGVILKAKEMRRTLTMGLDDNKYEVQEEGQAESTKGFKNYKE